MPQHPTFSLAGHVAVVTGVTKGIGRATAALFLELGARVIGIARTRSDLDALAREWGGAGAFATIAADLADARQRDAALDELAALAPDGIDCLVNNVGTNLRKPLDDYTVADVRALTEVNVEAAFALSQGLKAALLRAPAGRGASVINVSSVASLNVVGLSTVGYAMTKSALDAMTRWMAHGWAPEGIRVNGVHPWYTETELTAPLLARRGLRERVAEVTPLGRVAEAGEVAACIAFLAMPAASYVTGAQLVVDGGYLTHGIAP